MLVHNRPLTPRQSDLVKAVAELGRDGVPPSLDEIAARLGLSLTRTSVLAHQCADRGAIVHERGRARSWRVASTSPRRSR